MTTTPKTTKSKTNGKGEVVGINVLLPRSVHRQLRVKALSNQQTLTEAVTEAVRTWVKR
jgi:hypothetical protein